MYDYKDYNKITDVLCQLDPYTLFTFTTSLYSKNKSQNTINPIHEEYNLSSGIMIRRRYSYHFNITKSKTETTDRTQIVLYLNDFIMFIKLLNMAMVWFDGPDFNNIFKKDKEGGYKVVTAVPPLQMEVYGNNFVGLEPTISFNKPGVRLYIGSSNVYTDISIERFVELHYIVNKFDPINHSAMMMNYIQRPEFGYNMTSFGNNVPEYVEETPATSTSNSNTRISFLDELAKLRREGHDK